MAAASSKSSRASRFSLLLLEDGEVLLSDVAVQYHFIADTPAGSALHPLESYPERFVVRSTSSSIRGRVKIGTHNIFFDSDDWRDPVIRIPFLSIQGARPARDNSRSRGSDDGVAKSPDEFDDDNSVLVLATSAVFQRELGTDHPYVDVQLKGKHIFTPLYSSAFLLLDEINLLLRITSTPSRRKRDEKLRELVRERESRVPFDITLLEHGVKENAMMDSAASAVYALSRTPGRFRITMHNVYFMPIHGDSSKAVERIPVGTIKSLRRLRHGCLNAALEIGFDVGESSKSESRFSTLMISFESFQVRERAMDMLLKITGDKVEMYERRDLEVALNKWRRGQMSNFDYLMYVNMAAGRSFNDLSQYPVFPWILRDYSSDVLNLSREETFRDLSKPVGALEPERFAALKQRYDEMPPPKFLYGTHYSTPAYTINYLVRAAPAAMLRLQNGRFDTPDRLFNNIAAAWRGVLRNQGDVKELIPEFFTTDYSSGNSSGIVSSKSSPGEFLDNVLGLDLGTRQDGKRVDDVELPPWANGSSQLFVKRNREALESDYVSSKLHSWIDLIFGIKSRSAEHDNVFYTDVALPSSIDSKESSKLTAEEMTQIETVYLEFGRTPEQVFAYPHPPRFGDSHGADASLEDISWQGIEERTYKKVILNDTNELLDAKDIGPDNLLTKNGEVSDNVSNAYAATDSVASSPLSKSAWGAHCRRRDSVLAGASDHILVSYEPSQSGEGMTDTQRVSAPSVSHIISPGNIDDDLTIIDICLVRESTLDAGEEGNARSWTKEDSEVAVLCTVWSDGYLKVHSEKGTLRSKYIGDASSIVYIPSGIIAYGTLAGSISLYYIESGRTEEVEPAAHDAEIHALDYAPDCSALVSGSMDASVKLWRLEQHSHRHGALRLIQELDAESPIDDVSCAFEAVSRRIGQAGATGAGTGKLLVSTAASDGQLLAWELDLFSPDQEFPEPKWRCENPVVKSSGANSSVSTRRVRKVAWLYQGKTRKHALATLHEAENCVRVWSLDQQRMASAEAFLSDGAAKCVTSCDGSRTVLVGGRNGQISEFDSTGLCLGRISTGNNEIRNVLLPENGKCMYVLAGTREVLRVNR